MGMDRKRFMMFLSMMEVKLTAPAIIGFCG
jgi:hypothetical protein